MMWWYGNSNGMDGWGYTLMTVSMVLFWGLIIYGVIATVRYLGRQSRAAAARPTAEEVLAERFAHGQIDEPEYSERLSALRAGPRPSVKP